MYIKRTDLLELYENISADIDYEKLSVPIPVVRQNILDMPAADVVEVVRCKDCVHSKYYSETEMVCYEGREGSFRLGINPRGFCEKGTRAQKTKPDFGTWTLEDNGDYLVCPTCKTEYSRWLNEIDLFDHCPKCGEKLRGENNG